MPTSSAWAGRSLKMPTGPTEYFNSYVSPPLREARKAFGLPLTAAERFLRVSAGGGAFSPSKKQGSAPITWCGALRFYIRNTRSTVVLMECVPYGPFMRQRGSPDGSEGEQFLPVAVTSFWAASSIHSLPGLNMWEKWP